jgi:hypothetical protein
MADKKIKPTLLLHLDSLQILDKLSQHQAGELFQAIKYYGLYNELPKNLSPIIDLVITPFVNQFARDQIKYEVKCKANAENGQKGGRPSNNIDNPNNPDGFLNNPNNPNEPDNKNKNKNKKDNDSENKNKKETFLSVSACKELIDDTEGFDDEEITALHNWIDHKYDNKKEKYRERGLKNVLTQCQNEIKNNRDICYVIEKSIIGGKDGLGWSGIGFDHIKFTPKTGGAVTSDEVRRTKCRTMLLKQCKGLSYEDSSMRLRNYTDGDYKPEFKPYNGDPDIITKSECNLYGIDYPAMGLIKSLGVQYKENLLNAQFKEKDFI